ncbi:MAG TPA: hypothetical protein VI423_07835 [Paenisporosarcina sp.]|nr:hypothetical protein [Paenisporosarcina sp.]
MTEEGDLKWSSFCCFHGEWLVNRYVFWGIVATFVVIVATIVIIIVTFKVIVATSTVIVATIQFPPNSMTFFHQTKKK